MPCCLKPPATALAAHPAAASSTRGSPVDIEALQLMQLCPHQAVPATPHLLGGQLSCLGITGSKHSAGMAWQPTAAGAAAPRQWQVRREP